MRKRKQNKKPRIILIITILLICGIAIGSYAKYSKQVKNNNLYQAQSFYFESDLLKEDSTPEYNLGENEKSISVVLKNNADDLRYSDVDIGYNVTLTTSSGTKIDEKTNQTIAGRAKNTATVTFNNLSAGTYLVTATATTPYTKTLTGKFTVNTSNNDVSYIVTDTKDSTNLNVTLTTNAYSGNVKITFPTDLEINNVDTNFSSLASGSAVLSVSANSEYNIQFFKTDTSKTYTKNAISITKAN